MLEQQQDVTDLVALAALAQALLELGGLAVLDLAEVADQQVVHCGNGRTSSYPAVMEDRIWTSRLRWRLRGARLWPTFAVLILLDALLLHHNPIAGDSASVVGGSCSRASST